MTIKDISRKTGYSVGTVSRVLNDQPNVSEKARKVILEAARESGFQLNTIAKQLKQHHTNTILVVVKGRSNELFGSLLEEISAQAAHLPYPLYVDYVDEEDNEVLRAVQLCREKKPLGVLFLGGNTESFRQHFQGVEQPCVLITGDAGTLEFPNLSSVAIDDRRAGYLAVYHLCSLGHRDIAVIGGDPAVSETARLRLDGCMAAFRELGLRFDPQKDYITGRFSYADGSRAAQYLMDQRRSFTAIFAMADVLAIGAIRALQDRGLRVPEDVSVMGFDGLTIGNYFSPRLSTVRQSVTALAQTSIALLKAGLEGQPACHKTIEPELEQKESTKKYRAN